MVAGNGAAVGDGANSARANDADADDGRGASAESRGDSAAVIDACGISTFNHNGRIGPDDRAGVDDRQRIAGRKTAG
jgi:hypothetical protein